MSKSLEKRNRNGGGRYEEISPYSVSARQKDQHSGAMDPQKIVLTLFRYKWIVLTLLILGGVGAWYYADSLDPVYETRGYMLISGGDRAGDNELSRIVSQTTGIGANATLANELQVLRSLTFARQVAERFMEENSGSPDEFPALWRNTEEDGYIPANIDHVASRIRGGLEFQMVNRESEVIQVAFKSSSAQEASIVANAVMDVYVEASTIQNRQAAEQTTEFLSKEREELRAKLDASEQRVKEYMDRTGIVRLDEQASGVVSRRNEVSAELEQLELDLEGVRQAISNQEEEMERIKPGLAEDFSDAVAPRIRTYQEQLGEYERERYLILSRNPGVRDRDVTPPRLKFLDEQIEDLKTEISELSRQIFSEDDEYMGMETAERTRMVTEIQGRLIDLRMQERQLDSRISAVRERQSELNQNFEALPNEMIELARLQREVEMNEQLYLNVARQYADMSTWKETQYGYGRVIDMATVPNSPVSPNKPILLVMGIVLGGFIAGMYITVREFFDNTINNMGEMKNSQLPMLATVPSLNKKLNKRNSPHFKNSGSAVPVEMVLLRERTSIVSESIRRLKNNIIYQNSNEPPKTIAVTSAEKGDGKSTIICNLAVAFAEEGFKTLLLDTDFRRPKVHTYFGYNNLNGVSNYLKGDLNLNDLVKNTDLNLLKVATAGTNTDRPETIVSSESFMKFLDRMEEVFDVIVMDTPPFGMISDSTALLQRVDATVVVAKYRKTSKAIFDHTIEELHRINANVSGFVLNDFDPRKDTSGYHGAGYYNTIYEGYSSYVE